jgi:hypothetical protein
MKKLVFVIAAGLLAFPAFGQWNNNGDNYTTGSLNVYETIRSGGDYQLGQDGPSYSYGEGRRLIFSGTGWSYDPMWISKFAVNAQVSELRAYLSADTNDKFVIGRCTDITTGGMSKLMVVGNNVGIGMEEPPQRLSVEGNIFSSGGYQLGQDGPSYSYGEGKRLTFSGTGWSYDPMWISKFAVDAQVSELRAYLSADTNDKFVIGRCTDITTGAMSKLMVVGNNVGIGTDNPYYKLDVNGTIRAKEVKVNLNSGADFVFEPGYRLKPLDEVHSFIKENKHLPEIPTAEEMTNGDTNLGELQVKLLQKIEELTLYVIQQNDEIQALKTKLTEMETAK